MGAHMSDNDDYSLMQEVFAALPSAVVVLDEHGTIVRANERAAQLLDCPELIGQRWLEVMAQAFRPQNDDGHEISTRTGRRLQVSTTPLRSGQLIHMTDLTETRLLQDKLAHMERLSSLGRMAASLAHQIRTPLSAAILYAANLGNANLMPTARKRFQEKLMSRLEALEAQVSDILMFARSNDMTVGELDAQSLLSATENNVAAVVSKSHVLLETEAPHGAIAILGNSSALVGALSNLVANAVEAGASHIILRLEADADKVSLAVANNGPQIPEELKAKIFEPFFTSKSSGTGLGLAVVTAVTKVHQGTLTLSSWNEQFATVFTITIPRAPAASVPPPAGLNTPPPAEFSAAPTAELSAAPTEPPSAELSAAQATSSSAAGRSDYQATGLSAAPTAGLSAPQGMPSSLAGLTASGATGLAAPPAGGTDYPATGLSAVSAGLTPAQPLGAELGGAAESPEPNLAPSEAVGGLSAPSAWSVPGARTLPPTAADISAQAATDANSATSAAFAAYLKRQQEKNGLAAYAAARSTVSGAMPSAESGALPEALSALGATPASAAEVAPDAAPSGLPVEGAARAAERGAGLPSELKAAFSQEEFESWLAKVSGPKS